MSTIPVFKKEDFVLCFESRGNPFIFEDVLVRKYIPDQEYLTVHDGKRLKVLIPTWTLKETNAIGIKRTTDDTKDAIAALNKVLELAWGECVEYKNKESFELEDFVAMIKRFDSISQAYGYFDISFWDSTYEKSRTESEAKDKIKLIEGYKNKVRPDIGNIYFGEEGYLGTLLLKLSQKFSLPKETLKKYSVNDLRNLFQGIQIDNAVLNERTQFVFHKKSNNEIDFYVGEEAQKIARIFSDQVESLGIFKGTTAHSTGEIVKAKVKLISRDYADEEKMQAEMAAMKEGEVLVSETTEPALLPALRKASAIVTDVGGMLSHTAIFAREFNIPCVVGTGNASKTLKDGDMVEVNTNTGIIKIIN